MVAFTDTYSTVKGGCLATNIFIKKYVKRNTIVAYLLQPDCLQFVNNFTTFTS